MSEIALIERASVVKQTALIRAEIRNIKLSGDWSRTSRRRGISSPGSLEQQRRWHVEVSNCRLRRLNIRNSTTLQSGFAEAFGRCCWKVGKSGGG